MESFSRGWSFLRQAWAMAFKDRDLIKPSIYALIAGMVVSVVGMIPIIGAELLLPESQIGRTISFVLGAILIFVQFVVSYIFSAMTVYLIYGFLAEGDGRMDRAWGIVRRDFMDLLTLAAASTAVNLLRSLAERNRRGGLAAGVARTATSLLQVLWTETSFLVLPAMVIDDLSLKDGLSRVLKIAKENLLLIGISTVGVGLVTGLIGFLLGLSGAVLGLLAGFGLYSAFGGQTTGLVLGIALGALVFFAFVMVASVISTYTRTAYHTCLYLWARDTEKAREQGVSIPVRAPAPLAMVLGNAA